MNARLLLSLFRVLVCTDWQLSPLDVKRHTGECATFDNSRCFIGAAVAKPKDGKHAGDDDQVELFAAEKRLIKHDYFLYRRLCVYTPFAWQMVSLAALPILPVSSVVVCVALSDWCILIDIRWGQGFVRCRYLEEHA